MTVQERQSIVTMCLTVIATSIERSSYSSGTEKRQDVVKCLRQNSNRKRILRLCTQGNNQMLSSTAALVYCGVLRAVEAKHTEWMDLLEK